MEVDYQELHAGIKAGDTVYSVSTIGPHIVQEKALAKSTAGRISVRMTGHLQDRGRVVYSDVIYFGTFDEAKAELIRFCETRRLAAEQALETARVTLALAQAASAGDKRSWMCSRYR